MRLFKKKETPGQTDIVYEKWHTSFSVFQEHRFNPEAAEDYSSSCSRGRLTLDLRKKNLFAWTDDPLYRYDNFLLKAELGINADNGYSSAGFLFRRTDDLSYYYFLVSNRGHYRLDLVLNGTPSVLIDWTPTPEFNPEKFSILISADESSLSLYLNGIWLGNAADESLTAGGISFAGQNYDESDAASFTLHSIDLESRPGRLEAKREKQLPADIPVDARLAFAESRMRSGHYSAALIEIRKVLPLISENADALMMASDCCMSLEMYGEASALLDKVPENSRTERYFLQKAGILYLMNDFIALRDLLAGKAALLEKNAVASNLLGNAEYSLGNWERSAEAYYTAFALDGNEALFAFNAARALDRCGRKDEAAAMYGKAARRYFRTGDYDALAALLPFLEELDEKNPETRILKAKLLFQDNDFDAAGEIFKDLINEKAADSTVFYLNALIEARNSRPRKASESFKKAVALEPDYYLYQFKFAEYLFVTGGRYDEYLKKAAELAPDDPWVQNLSGQVEIANGDYPAASVYFEKALTAAPDEDEIRVNYSESLFLAGRADGALELLEDGGPDILNQRGNIFSRLENYGAAVEAYEAAISEQRNRPDIMLNLAAACIENDAFSRAEELLGQVLDFGDSAQAYNLIGNLALLKGEYSRAEASYRKAVETDNDYVEAVCNLAELFISRERLNDADLLLGGFRGTEPGERFETLKQKVFRRRMNIYSCCVCSEEWIVPKKIAAQPALQLVGEPPDSMPAGKCTGCGRVYCIGCAKEHLADGRLVCAECGERLKLSEDWMRWLYHEQGY